MDDFNFIIWADAQGSDAFGIEALSYDGEHGDIQRPPIASGDFVIIHDPQQDNHWFGQVTQPQLNLPLQGLSRDNPSNVSALERVLEGTAQSSVFLRQVYYYRIALLGEFDNGVLRSVTRRPRVGSLGRKATSQEVIQFMDLPVLADVDRWATSIVGRIRGVDIPIAVDDRRLYYHLLVAGATGSGKSNTVANVIKAAQQYGMCVIVFDHKPDYQDMHKPNDEVSLFGKFSGMRGGFSPAPLENVAYMSLYDPDDIGRRNENEIPISVMASDIPRSTLASALFYRQGEELQREAFYALSSAFQEHLRDRGTHHWTITALKNWYRGLHDNQLAACFDGDPPMPSVLEGMGRRLNRAPNWIDALGAGQRARGGVFDNGREDVSGYFNLQRYLAPGHILSIRINVSGREYGLFLSYMLRQLSTLRRNREINFPILNIIDEAQDIFQAEKDMRDSSTYAINETLRKGRSMQIGFVFAAQSASQIPDTILNNLNSRIIHRQNTADELRSAIPGVPNEVLRSALTFGPGEALVKMYLARSVVHAEMAPSPFELTKDLPISFATLADQLEAE